MISLLSMLCCPRESLVGGRRAVGGGPQRSVCHVASCQKCLCLLSRMQVLQVGVAGVAGVAVDVDAKAEDVEEEDAEAEEDADVVSCPLAAGGCFMILFLLLQLLCFL